MTPGRELDKLVHEQVMEEKVETVPGFAQTGMFAPQYPPYSTDIAAVWPVWQKFRFNIFPDFPEPGMLHIPEGQNMCDDFGCTEKCVTVDSIDAAPFAICLAALKAVEGQ